MKVAGSLADESLRDRVAPPASRLTPAKYAG